MYKVAEYFVFYLKLESIGAYEDLLSIGVKDSSYRIEKSQSKELVDTLAGLMTAVDRDLRMFEGYATGVGAEGVRMQHFGPVFIAYLQNLNKESVKALYSMMALRLPRILRKMGANGRFVRGAFVKGYGWEIREADCCTLYGPVMNKAWHFLTEMAYSPRIIIEPEIYEIVGSRACYGPGKDGDWLPLYATLDYDGQAIFDYLAHDTIPPALPEKPEDVVSEMQQTLRVIHKVTTNMASVYYKHDNSNSIRMAVSLQSYVLQAICKWTVKSESEVMRETLPGMDAMYRKIMGQVSR